MNKGLVAVNTGILLDTNIWIDIFSDTSPHHQESKKAYEEAIKREIPLFFSINSISDINYLLISKAKNEFRSQGHNIDDKAARTIRAYVQSQIETMGEFAIPVGLDAADMWLALKLRSIHDDLEDDFILAAANRCKADYLLTWDKSLLKNTWIKAITPIDFLALLSLG